MDSPKKLSNLTADLYRLGASTAPSTTPVVLQNSIAAPGIFVVRVEGLGLRVEGLGFRVRVWIWVGVRVRVRV